VVWVSGCHVIEDSRKETLAIVDRLFSAKLKRLACLCTGTHFEAL
jgi:hypothetical protein